MIVHNKQTRLLELTIPFHSSVSLNNTHRRKSEKQNYQILMTDRDASGKKISQTNWKLGPLAFATEDSVRASYNHV